MNLQALSKHAQSKDMTTESRFETLKMKIAILKSIRISGLKVERDDRRFYIGSHT